MLEQAKEVSNEGCLFLLHSKDGQEFLELRPPEAYGVQVGQSSSS